MKTLSIIVVSVGLGALAGFSLGYALLARPAVSALEAERKNTRQSAQDLDSYRAAVKARDAQLSKILTRMSGIAQGADSINPKALSAISDELARELERPISAE